MRVALGIEYDGSDFCGWQRQAEGRTVQACVEQALSRVADHDVQVVCAGRTDTGVHATGQVIHFDTGAIRAPRAWIRGGNANLSGDIRVQWATPVDAAFHARFAARQRHYRYVILNRDSGSALLQKRACREHIRLDESRMAVAAGHLEGEHDFTSFRAAACQAHSPVRTIYQLEVRRSDDFIYIDVQANAFLHHMVRCIAGVLIAVGRGEQSPAWVAEVLAATDRKLGGFNATPAGLYLVGVRYPEAFKVPTAGWLPTYG
jgi:tRNA pseudouridine38-40 synthase